MSAALPDGDHTGPERPGAPHRGRETTGADTPLQGREPLTEGETEEGGEVVDRSTTQEGFSLREVDRRNGTAARARKQFEASPRQHVDDDGNVVNARATALVVPEEKRCEALTVHGVRCRAPKMRGIRACIFHAHTALSDETLAQIVDDPERVKPRLSPRAALKAVVSLRAEELAEAAVGGALAADGANRTRAVLTLVDAVDPFVQAESTLTLSREGAETATWKQLFAVFGSDNS